ncbi:putative oxidoreductase [Porphyridium purpureum]|uniref:Putative oxidoreductase n=1 Tax=Porphyridium purpureum TaxID=35688 RepID=A0A5J4YI34_PORPP|nr:putative oxidoreductase [Porphyridium purpureum]|eukprot:POR9416..scf251_18
MVSRSSSDKTNGTTPLPAGAPQELVLVTGITGFVGGHVAAACLRHGYRVRGSLRSLAKAKTTLAELQTAFGSDVFARDRVEFVQLDLEKDENWDSAMQGCTYVLHVASPVSAQEPKNPEEEMIRPAIEGVKRAFLKAVQAGCVKRFVYTSSIAAIIAGHDYTAHPPRVFDESDWSQDDGPTPMISYEKSKLYAERALWELYEKHKDVIELSVVNPGYVIGRAPCSYARSSLHVVTKIMQRQIPLVPALGFESVHASDVAELHILCMTKPEAVSERFCAVGGFLWLYDMAHELQAAYPERKIVVYRCPSWLMQVVAAFDKEVHTFRHLLNVKIEVSSAKAYRLLGWTTQNPMTGLLDAAKSLEHLF